MKSSRMRVLPISQGSQIATYLGSVYHRVLEISTVRSCIEKKPKVWFPSRNKKKKLISHCFESLWLQTFIAGQLFKHQCSSHSTQPLTGVSKARTIQFLTWKNWNYAERSLSIVFAKHVLNPVGCIAVFNILPTQQPQRFNIAWWSLHIFAGIIHCWEESLNQCYNSSKHSKYFQYYRLPKFQGHTYSLQVEIS